MKKIIKKVFIALFNNQSGGTAILITVLMLTSILTATLAVSDIIRNGLLTSNIQVNSTKAYFAAEAAAEKIIWEIRKNGHDPSTCGSGNCYLFDGVGNIIGCDNECDSDNEYTLSNNARFMIKYEFSAPDNKLICYGRFKDVGRVVQLIY